MSWSRQRYDDCTYKHMLSETIGVGEYMTQTPRNCDDCTYYAPGITSGRGVALCDALIDVDSEMLCITRKASKCPSDKYLPTAEPFCPLNKNAYKECIGLVPEPTLISNPKCTNKETTVNRWEWLCMDPQKNALAPFEYLVSNRLVVKDNHRPLIEKPLNQTDVLPPKCNNNVQYDWASRYSQTKVEFPHPVQLSTCGVYRKL